MSTQNAGNWPDPERPDVPMFPERDGKHVINIDPEGSGSELVYYWKAGHQIWVEYEHCGVDEALDGYDLIGWSYVGPCLTPEQIAEMLAAERERCMQTLRKCVESTTVVMDKMGEWVRENGPPEYLRPEEFGNVMNALYAGRLLIREGDAP